MGIDEGWTVAEKLSLIKKGRLIARRFGLPDKVGILSGGRLGDVGRHAVVDRSMADADLLHDWGMAFTARSSLKMQCHPVVLSLHRKVFRVT